MTDRQAPQGDRLDEGTIIEATPVVRDGRGYMRYVIEAKDGARRTLLVPHPFNKQGRATG